MATPDYLKSMVFPGESGGDYGALFGYANRPGGAFAGVDLTKMSVNDVIKFTDPSGPYAQWVKGQLGYVATPTGGYQVVGSTLRDAVSNMGLTGNEIYDQATQDAIGMWIYENQGPQAWEAWGKGGGGGMTASSKGGAPMGGLLEVPQQDPSGLVGLLTGQQKPWASRANDIGAMLLALSGSPAAQPIMAQLEKRKDRAAEAAKTNKTLEWLASQGRSDLVAAVQGGLSPSEAMGIALTPVEAPAPVKGVEVDGKLVDPVTGEIIYEGEAAAPAFRRATPEEAAAYGASAGQFGPDGRFYPIDVPQGMTIESDGQGGFRMVQGPAGAAGAPKPFTEGQSKDVVFATRAKGALETLDPIAGALTSRGEVMADWLPLGLGGGLQTDEFQTAKTAGDEFLAAILRKDTGAAITADEKNTYGTIYLPQPGDSEARLAYKAEARKRAVAALEAGMNAEQIAAQERALSQGETPAATGGAGLAVGTVEDGYRYLGGDPSLPTSWEAVK